MAELCKKCFIETWHPNAYGLEHIIMSDDNDFCEYCEAIPDEYDFSTIFPTWIIAFCPDTDSWFVTNQRFFYYEYNKEFITEEDGIEYFKKNPKIFYDEEMRMDIYRPTFRKNSVWLENINNEVTI